jgi:hypothetical protein
VVDGAIREEAARRETGMAGPDDYRRDALDDWILRGREATRVALASPTAPTRKQDILSTCVYTTSTVTFTGLVMAS